MIRRLKVTIAALFAASLVCSETANAQGIPVIDVANLMQTIQQVGTAHDIGHTLPRIVEHDGQLIGVEAVAATDDEIAYIAAQVLSDPSAAAATLSSMLPADVTEALKEVRDPDALRQILPSLTPAQKGPAAEGAIKAMAANDLNAAFTWAKSLEMGERERDTLLATGIEAAVTRFASQASPNLL